MLRLGLRDGYDLSDIMLVASGVAIIILLVERKAEPFLFMSVIMFLFLCLSMFVRAPRIQRMPVYLPEALPWVSLMHLVFWVLQLIFTLMCGTVQHAINCHERQHHRAEIFRGVWVILGFSAGFTPGSARLKLMEFALASVAINMRQLALALTWERSQADCCRPVEVLANVLPALARDIVLRTAAYLRRITHALWLPFADEFTAASPPEVGGCCVETDGAFACAEPRISVEIMVGGFKSLGVAAFVGLCLGMIARSKWETAQLELKERRTEVAALLSHTVTLEAARREALVRDTVRRRTRGGRRSLSQPPLQSLGEECDVDDVTTFRGDTPEL